MKLTFDEAIANHRKMWIWIADETKKRKKIISKCDYFEENNIEECDHLCFCCQYTVDNGIFSEASRELRDCELCPIDWGVLIVDYCSYYECQCFEHNTPYDWWGEACDLKDWKLAAKYARQIANLPVRREQMKC